jgi:hygromycin-B 7''-O-kinase
VVDLHPLFEQPLVVSRFLPGHQLAPSDVIPQVWAAVGNQLRRLHEATLEQTPIGLRVFVQTAEIDLDVLTGRLRAAGRVSTERARQLYDLREALVRHVVGHDRLVLCHGDMHAGNVIAHDGQLEGLVDFAGAGWLDAAWDFVGVPVAAVPLMLEGYRWNAPPDDTLLERVTWCPLQVALHRALGSARPVHDITRALADAAHLLG